MKRYSCFAVLCVILLGGCHQITVCNGTSEQVTFDVGDFADTTATVGPCSCQTLLVLTLSRDPELDIHVLDRTGAEIGSLHNLDPSNGGDSVITYDGWTTVETRDGIPDLTNKKTVQLCNTSSAAVKIYPDPIAAPSDIWLLQPGESREFGSVHEGQVAFEESATNSRCTFELVDGVKVTWDGVQLSCGGGGTTTVSIEFVHEGIPSSEEVYLIAEGESLTFDKLLFPGHSKTFDYPIGAPITFQAWSLDGVLLDDAVLADPTDGDIVVWLPPDLFVIDN